MNSTSSPEPGIEELHSRRLLVENPAVESSRSKPTGRMVTVEELAAHLQVPVEFLRENGWRNKIENGRSLLTVSCTDEDGNVQSTKVRLCIASCSKQKYRSFIPGLGAHVYGDHCLHWIRRIGHVVFVEGETDSLACWYAGIPALGVPGATNLGTIKAHHLERANTVYIVEERDKAGRRFVSGVENRVRQLGFMGEVRSMRMPNGAKDVCELRLQDPAKFAERFQTALETAGHVTEFGEGTSLPRKALHSKLEAADSKPAMLACAAGIKPESVDWLLFPYIAKRKLTILEGDPGLGKSWFCCALAAAVSRGTFSAIAPGLLSSTSDPASVVLANFEDGPGDTLRPRLDALGADVNLIQLLVNPAPLVGRSLIEFEAEIAAIRPHLIVIDPLVAAIGAGVDMNRANEARAVTSSLARIAERQNCAVLLVRHLGKGRGGGNATNAGLGSIDFVAAVRSVLLLGADPKDPSHRGLIHTKSNLAPTGVTFGFRLLEGCFEWTGESTLTVDEILQPEQHARASTKRQPARDKAGRFIEECLAGGPVKAAVILKAAEDRGISKKTLERAKKAIGVVSRHDGFQGPVNWEHPGHTSSDSLNPVKDTSGDEVWENGGGKDICEYDLAIHRHN